MTVKQLKKQLDKLPDNAEAIFRLWQADDAWHYFQIRESDVELVPIGNDEARHAAIIGKADNCRADKMQMKNGKLFY